MATLEAFPPGTTENVSSHTFPRTVCLPILLHNYAPMKLWVNRSQFPRDVSSDTWRQIPVPFLSSCLAELITTGFENHWMDLEVLVCIKSSRHGIFICFSIPIAFNPRSSKFHCRICLDTWELQECSLSSWWLLAGTKGCAKHRVLLFGDVVRNYQERLGKIFKGITKKLLSHLRAYWLSHWDREGSTA